MHPSFRVLAPLAHCEGIARAPDGALWTASEGGSVWRLDPSGGDPEEVARVAGWPLGVSVDGAGRVYLCLYEASSIVRVDPSTGGVEPYCDRLVDGTALATPNFAAFADDGALYVSLSGSEGLDVVDGRIALVPPGGGPAELVDLPPLNFPNGLALAADGTLYVAESFASRILTVCDGEVEVFAELPRTIPDGVAHDAQGGLIVACYQPNAIFRVGPEGGKAEVLVEDWTGIHLLTPTNVAFFGDDLGELAISSLGGYHLAAIRPGVSGARLAYPNV